MDRRCPECERPVRLTKAGKFRKHVWRKFTTCPGSGQEPAPYRSAGPSLPELDAYGMTAGEYFADDPPEYGPDDAEPQRIAEVYADAAAEMYWIDEAGA